MDIEKGFEFAANQTQQMITLSTAIVSFSVTFSKAIAKQSPRRSAAGVLYAAWLLHLLSILSGVLTLMAITGSIVPTDAVQRSIRDSNVVIPSTLQFVAFAAGIALIVAYGVLARRTRKPAASKRGSRLLLRARRRARREDGRPS